MTKGGTAHPVDSMTQVHFEPTTHTYTLNGRRMPSVSEILRDAGLVDGRWWTDEGRTRGQYVAQLTHYYDDGDLDFESLTPELKGYLDSWRAFRNMTKCEILSAEEVVVNEALGYAGTLDRRIRWNHREKLIDIKLGSSQPFHRVQTALYAMTFPRRMDRGNVILGPKPGKFKWIPHEDKTDFQVAQSAAVVVAFRRLHGLIEENPNARDNQSA